MSMIIYVSGFNTESENQDQVCSLLKKLFHESDVYHYSDYPPKGSPSIIKDQKIFKYINQKDAIPEYACKLERFISSKGKLEEAIVIGHSLGAALVFEFLKNIKMRKRIRTAILLGAAFPKIECGEQNFHDLVYSVTHSVLNLHNPSDKILQKFYKVYEGVKPIGLVGMPIQSTDFIKNLEFGTQYSDPNLIKVENIKDFELNNHAKGLALAAASLIIPKQYTLAAMAITGVYETVKNRKEKFGQEMESHAAINYLIDLIDWLKKHQLNV